MTRRPSPARAALARIGVIAAAAVLLTLFALPLVSLFVRVPAADLLARMRDPIVLRALRLSLLTTACTSLTIVVLGLPIAYLLATRAFPGKRVLEVLVELPMVLPPTVAGFALLLAFGRM